MLPKFSSEPHQTRFKLQTEPEVQFQLVLLRLAKLQAGCGSRSFGWLISQNPMEPQLKPYIASCSRLQPTPSWYSVHIYFILL